MDKDTATRSETCAGAIIRRETPGDVEAIARVTDEAFRTVAVSRQTERYIIDALRAAGALAVSLVAEVEGQVVGHVAFSPVSISDGAANWYGLGPVSVLPQHQRQGIGSALIREGLSIVRSRGGQGCCLVGYPDYYKRFGFAARPQLIHEGVPPEVFVVLPFGEPAPSGVVTFHEGFQATGGESPTSPAPS